MVEKKGVSKMGKVVNLAPKAGCNNNIVKLEKERDLFHQALSKANKQSGIDFLKLIDGDEKTNQRYKMKQFNKRMEL
jgi:hypothetical protein